MVISLSAKGLTHGEIAGPGAAKSARIADLMRF